MSTPPIDSPAGQLRTALRGHGDESERIDAIGMLRQRLADEEAQIAFSMRLRGDAWEDIAQAFGISRQAAHKRFSGAATLDRLRDVAASRASATPRADRLLARAGYVKIEDRHLFAGE